MRQKLDSLLMVIRSIDAASVKKEIDGLSHAAKDAMAAARMGLSCDDVQRKIDSLQKQLDERKELEAEQRRIYRDEMGPLDDKQGAASRLYLDWQRVDLD